MATYNGTAGNDTYGGSLFADTISTGNGNDSVAAGGGNDIVDGGAGNDTLLGGSGADTLTGGSGADVFFFKDVGDSRGAAFDVITDFQVGVDKIDITRAAGSFDLYWGYKTPTAFGVWIEHRGGDTYIHADYDGINVNSPDLTIRLVGIHNIGPGDFLGVQNQAPVAVNDAASATEDSPAITGNVLANDSDPDQGTQLQVTNPGTYVLAFGTLVLAADGSYTYTPNTAALQSLDDGESRSDVLSYTISDGLATSTALLTITITGTNDAPVVTGTSLAVSEDGGTIAGGVSGSDVDGETLTYSIVGGAPAGVLFNPATGAFVYDPSGNQDLAAGQTRTITFQVVANDGTVSSAPAQVTIVVSGENDAPTIDAAVAVEIDENTSATGVAMGMDVDNGDILTYSVGSAGNGIVTIDPSGAWTYTPATDFVGQDSFVITVTDGLESATQTVTVDVLIANVAPTIDPTAAAVTDEDTPVDGVAMGADADMGDVLTYSAGNGANGLVSIDPTTGAWTYTPDANFNGNDSFVITVSDGSLDATQTVSVTVNAVADLVAADDSFSTDEDVPFSASVAGNDVTTSGGPLAYTLLTNVANGTLNFDSVGFFTYTPNSNYSGSDSFTYVVADEAAGETATRTVTISVNPVDDLVSADDAFTVNEDGLLSDSVATNDTTTSMGPLSFALLGNVSNGTLDFNPDGSFTYTPAANFNGSDSFTYEVTDAASGESATHTATITVAAVNDAPVAQDAMVSGSEDDASISGTVAADDVEGDALTYAVVGAAPAGVTFNSDGTFSYDPSALVDQSLDDGESNVVTFQYTANDGTTDSLPATVTITIVGANDAPVAQDATASGSEDDAAITGSVLATDVDDEPLTYALVGGPVAGLTFNADGTFSYDPSADQDLDDGETREITFQYVANDGTVDSAPANVTITVNGANDAPMLAPAVDVSGDEDEVISGNAGAVDVDGDVLSYVATDGAHGEVDIDSSGVWTYTPDANFHGTDTFAIVVTDGTVSSTQMVTVTVNPVVDLTAADDVNTTDEDTPVSGDVSGNDSTLSGGALTYAAGNAANGVVAMNADGSYTYTPAANFHGTDSFTYTVTDAASSESLVQTVTITVNPVVDLVAANDSFTVAEDNLLTDNLAANDSTTSGGALSYELGDDAANGTVTVNPDGSFSYQPDLNYFGSDSFTYIVTDSASGESSEQTVTVTITPVNDAPTIDPVGPIVIDDTAADDSYAPITGTLSGEDVDNPFFTFGLTGGTDNGNGTVSLTGPYGTLTLNQITGAYTFVVNDTAVDAVPGLAVMSFNYTLNASDGSAFSSQTLTIQVNGANDTPDITGVGVGDVLEDIVDTASGTLTIVDRDTGESSFQAVAPAALIGIYGDFTFNEATGEWEYTLRNGDANVQALANGQQVTDTLTVTSFDGSTDYDIEITVTGSNDRPTVADVSVSGSEDDAAITGLADGDDTDANDVLTYAVVGAAPAGVTFNSDGTFSYDPSALVDQSLDDGESNVVTFQYTANDGTTDSLPATATITIVGANDAPVAQDATASGSEDDAAITGSVLATDVDDEPLTYALVGGPVAGLTFNPDGTFSYDPSADQDLDDGETRTIAFQYVANDGTVDSAPANVTITVNGANDAPVAQDATASGSEDDLSIDGTVTATDVDVEALTYALVGGPVAGLTFNPDGTFSYDPSADQDLAVGQTRDITFQYVANDGTVDSAPANVTITVSGANDAPVIAAGNDTGLVWEDGDLDNVREAGPAGPFEPNQSVDVAALLTPGYDMGAVLAAVQAQLEAANPGASLADAIAVVWDYVDDNFSYYNSTINEVGVRLGVEYADYLVAGGKPLLDVTVKFTADGPDGGTAPDRQQSMHDNLLGNLNGFGMADKLNGGGDVPAGSNPMPQAGLYDALVALMTSRGHAALLARPVYSGNEGTVNNSLPWDQANGYVPAASGQLVVNDVDDGATASWSGSGVGDYGMFAIDALTGAWTYTLDNVAAQGLKEGQVETEEFVVTVTDEFGATDTRTVTITVKGSNDAPVAVADTATIGENQSALIDVVANDTDVDDDAVLTVAGATIAGGAGGSVLVAGGSIEFDPGTAYDSLAAGASTSVVIDYVVADEFGATSRSTLTLTINGVNDPATIIGTATDAVEEAPGFGGGGGDPMAGGTLTVLDVDSGENVFAAVDVLDLQGTYGSFTFNSLTGVWTYALDNLDADTQALKAGDIVSDSLLVSSVDGTASQNIVVTILGANDNPDAVADTATVAENGTVSIDVLDNDVDVEGDTLVVTGASLASGLGGVTFTAGGVDYDPGTNYDSLAVGESATVTIEYTISDGNGGTDSAIVTVTVTGENDAPMIVAGGNTGSVTEAGDLPGIFEAGLQGKLEPSTALNSAVLTAIANAGGLPASVAEMDALLAAVMTSQGVDMPTAIAAVWDNLDDLYSSYYVDDVNRAFVLLGVEYAAGLKDGSLPSFINITAKYTADGGDVGDAPDRLQSMHDNLLGNLTQIGIADRFGLVPVLRDELLALVSSVDADLLVRPVFSGNEGSMPTEAESRAFDLANGFVNKVSGQLQATDIDNGAVLTWSGSANGTYGSFVIASNGQWTYNLDDQLVATQALAAGETVSETFDVTVTDEHGASDTTTVTVTITGSNDAPEIVSAQTAGAVTEGGTLSDSGEIVFADVDVTDTHSVQATPAAGGYVGTFTPVLNQATQTVEWTFSVADGDIDHLAAGETVAQVYRVSISDGNGGVVNQDVTVTITGANDGPTIAPTAMASTTEDNDATGTAIGFDVDGDTLSYSKTDGTNGSVTVNASSGEWVYTPDANFNGTDSFTITVTDGLESASQVVTVTVAAEADLTDIGWAVIDFPVSGTAVPGIGEVVGDLEPDVAGFSFQTAAGSASQFSVAADGTVMVTSALSTSSVYTLKVEAVSDVYGTVEHAETFTIRTGSGAADVISADATDNIIYGLAGADTIYGNDGNDILYGQNGNDSLSGGAGDDLLVGDANNDTLNGGTGSDTLIGGTANDHYVFGLDAGVDTVFDANTGTSGGDRIVILSGGAALTSLNASYDSGTDQAAIEFDGNSVTVLQATDVSGAIEQIAFDGASYLGFALTSNVYSLILDGAGSSGRDVLAGTSGNDSQQGLGSADVLFGNAGNDTLDGGAGADLILGGEGDDVLVGGTAADTLVGGAGNDTIDAGGNGDADVVAYFDADSGTDVINNFDANSSGGQDFINLDGLFDSLGFTDAERAFGEGFTIMMNGLYIDLDNDNGFEYHLATVNIVGMAGGANVFDATDVIVGTL